MAPYYVEKHPKKAEAYRYAQHKLQALPPKALESTTHIVLKIASAALITEESLPDCILKASNGCTASLLHLALRCLAGLNTPEDREKSTYYLRLAISKVVDTQRESELQATAHVLLLESLGAIMSRFRTPPELEVVQEAEYHANEALRLRPSAPIPPNIIAYCHQYKRFLNECQGFMVHDALWNAVGMHDEKQQQKVEKLRDKIRQRPMRYQCAAAGCGIEADKPTALRKCAGECDEQDKPHYCSAKCQKEDWKIHKPHCKSGGQSRTFQPSRLSDPNFDIELAGPPGKFTDKPVIQTIVGTLGKEYRVKASRKLLKRVEIIQIPGANGHVIYVR